MSVVQNYSQMEEAVKRNALDVLVIGKLAEQIKIGFGKSEKVSLHAENIQALLLKQLERYTIDFREESRYAPIVLSRKTSDDQV